MLAYRYGNSICFVIGFTNKRDNFIIADYYIIILIYFITLSNKGLYLSYTQHEMLINMYDFMIDVSTDQIMLEGIFTTLVLVYFLYMFVQLFMFILEIL